MGFSYSLIVFGFVLFLSLEMGMSLKCYSCSSLIHGSICDDPVNRTSLSQNIIQCKDDTACVKQIMPLIGDVRSIQRNCASKDACTGLVQAASDHCSTCTGDLCNSSTSLRPLMSLMSIIPLFFFVKSMLVKSG